MGEVRGGAEVDPLAGLCRHPLHSVMLGTSILTRNSFWYARPSWLGFKPSTNSSELSWKWNLSGQCLCPIGWKRPLTMEWPNLQQRSSKKTKAKPKGGSGELVED